MPLNRLTLKTDATYANATDRPGYEIDVREHHVDTGFDGSVEVRALSKTFLGLTGQRTTSVYDAGDVFLGTDLQELNRTTTVGTATMRYQVSPLTSLSLNVSREQDRYDFSSLSSLRNANATSASGAVTFDPFALIKGTASVGFTDYQPLSPGLPKYKGLIATVGLSYTAFGATKLGVQASRGVEESYDVNQPYYVLTGATGTIAQQIFGPLDVTAEIGIQDLAYRDLAGAVVVVPDEIDQVHTYGGGLGYHLGQGARIGFTVDRWYRNSPDPTRQYNDWRYGTSVTYAF